MARAPRLPQKPPEGGEPEDQVRALVRGPGSVRRDLTAEVARVTRLRSTRRRAGVVRVKIDPEQLF